MEKKAMKILKIIALIVTTTIFTTTFGALYYVKNAGASPITVNIEIVENDGGQGLRALYAKDLQPGADTQLNAHGGWVARYISLKDKPLVGAYKGKLTFESGSGDYDLTFFEQRPAMWNVRIEKHKY
jgi:hypothetical protein